MSKIKLAIKFGSEDIIIYQKGIGILGKIPTFLALSNGNVKAFGKSAKTLYKNKSNNYRVYRAFKSGKVVDIKYSTIFMQSVLNSFGIKNLFLKNVSAIVAVPCSQKISEIDQLNIVFRNCGINKVSFVQNAVAVREYENLWQSRAYNCVVEIGKSSTEISILNDLDFYAGATFNIGGAQMDNALSTYIFDNYYATVTDEVLENIKCETASLYNRDFATSSYDALVDNKEMAHLNISAHEVRTAIKNVYDYIFKIVKDYIAEQSVSIISELHKNGIMFCGGVTCLDGFYEYAVSQFDFPIYFSKEPKNVSIYGCSKLLDMKKLPIKIKF